MRAIKFRAWSLRHKRMIYFKNPKHGIQYSSGELVVSTGWDSMGRPTYVNASQKHYIIMQFTGLLDYNGMEIYEGDVLRIWLDDAVEEDGGFWNHSVVTRVLGCFTSLEIGFDYKDDHDKLQSMLYEYAGESEVIGNIHAHPHLIKTPTNAH